MCTVLGILFLYTIVRIMYFTLSYDITQYVFHCITVLHYTLMGESNILNTIDVRQGTQRMYSRVTIEYTRWLQPFWPIF